MARKLTFFIAWVACVFSVNAQSFLLAGTYTSGTSKGIHVYRFNNSTGTASQVGQVAVSNPSYLCVSPNRKFVYAVEENADTGGNGGKVASFSFDQVTGALRLINEQPSFGNDPCYISTDKTGKWLAVGNYSSGTVAVFPLLADGTIGEAVDTVRHKGAGINTNRQSGAHVHCCIFSDDNSFLLVPDLGIDKVMIYRFNESTGKLTAAEQPFAKSIDGSGPRHLCFHPNNQFAYLIEELSGYVVVFDYKNGHLQAKQRISNLAKSTGGPAGSADIHVSPDGLFLYASNRGDVNSISIYRINQQSGRLKPVGYQSTGGKTPRNFSIDPSGNFVLVANQNSDEIVVFKRNKKTGLLTKTKNSIAVGNPVCLKWITAK